MRRNQQQGVFLSRGQGRCSGRGTQTWQTTSYLWCVWRHWSQTCCCTRSTICNVWFRPWKPTCWIICGPDTESNTATGVVSSEGMTPCEWLKLKASRWTEDGSLGECDLDFEKSSTNEDLVHLPFTVLTAANEADQVVLCYSRFSQRHSSKTRSQHTHTHTENIHFSSKLQWLMWNAQAHTHTLAAGMFR